MGEERYRDLSPPLSIGPILAGYGDPLGDGLKLDIFGKEKQTVVPIGQNSTLICKLH